MLGCHPCEIIGKSWRETVHLENHEKVEEAYRRMLKQEFI